MGRWVPHNNLHKHTTHTIDCQGLPIDEKSAEKLKLTAEELTEERQLALECIKEAAA